MLALTFHAFTFIAKINKKLALLSSVLHCILLDQ